MKISISVPSYKRPKVETLKYLPFAKIWVAQSEFEEYKKQNPKAKIIAVPDEVQGNVARIRNYIIDKELIENNFDVVVMMDDDYQGMYRWENKKKRLIEADEFLEFVEKSTIVADEWGARFWGVNINQDKQVYREYSPFSTTSFIGGPFQVIISGNPLRYDERIPLKEDYDYTLQNLLKYRKALRFNSYFYVVKQAKQSGGVASMRNFDKELSQLKLLQKKWGSRIVKFDNNDRSHNLKSSKTKIDFNPVISSPIKGI